MIDEMELIAALRPMLRVATEEDYAQVKACLLYTSRCV